jgi:hypothetical protein
MMVLLDAGDGGDAWEIGVGKEHMLFYADHKTRALAR